MSDPAARSEQPAYTARRRLRLGLAVLLALGAAIAVGLVLHNRRQVPNTPGDPELVRTLPRMNASTGYATSHECRECHPEEYASWHASYHRKMTQVAGPDSILGPFDGTEVREDGQVHRLIRKGDEFWVHTVQGSVGAAEGRRQKTEGKRQKAEGRSQKTEEGSGTQRVPGVQDSLTEPKTQDLSPKTFALNLKSDGPEPTAAAEQEETWRRVVMTTGSHNMQVCWTAGGNGNRLRELPVIYIRDARPDKSRWAPLEASYLSPSAPGVAVQTCWNKDCILCHATGGRPGTDSRATAADTKVAEVGIACEACHGPAERHVRMHRDRAAKSTESDLRANGEGLVNPARLRPERSAQVCGHCHALASFMSDQLIDDFLLSGSAYRPGDDLLQTRMTILPAHMTEEQIEAHRNVNPFFAGSYWPDGMARVAGREYNGLLESTCYQKGAMTCLSCHSMHRSAPDDQLSEVGRTNEACYQCHASYRDNLTAHTHHSAGSSGSECYNCHMPHTTYGLFKAIRGHQISSPNVAVTLATGRATACNLCHLDQTLGWSAEKLSDWYAQPVEELTDEQCSYSAVGLLLLKGNAVERALSAWITGWRPALEVTEKDGFVPLLATLLDDASPVIRLIASRSMSAVDPDYARDYDFVAPTDDLRASRQRVLGAWRTAVTAKTEKLPRRLFMDEHGQWDEELVQSLISERDNRSFRVRE